MRPLVIETGFPYDDLPRVPAAVRHIEALGFDGIIAPEINRDPFFPLPLGWLPGDPDTGSNR